MSPRKLSDSDRQEILNLYRTTDETTSTLANRFGVSSSTVSRFLKNNLSPTEYEDLIQEKRLARNPNYQGDYSIQAEDENLESKTKPKKTKPKKTKPKKTEQLSEKIDESPQEPESTLTDSQRETNIVTTNIETDNDQPNSNLELATEEEEIAIKPKSLISAPEITEDEIAELTDSEEDTEKQEEIKTEDLDIPEENDLSLTSELVADNAAEIYWDEAEDLESVDAIGAMFGEDIEAEDWDDEEEEDDEDETELIETKSTLSIPDEIKVLPLSKAVFPRKCYLAVDRSSELITRPLKDFRDLGKIPKEETQQQTLPIFDNHRVAKRFCDRKGKVIKLPSGTIVQKTSTYLQAKGITRLLINGKIYSLW